MKIGRRWALVLSSMMLAVAAMPLLGCDENTPANKAVSIGLVTNNSNGMKNVAGFRDGMTALGYVEGENVVYVTPGKPVRAAELETVLNDFVDREVDLIFTAGTPTGVAAHRTTGKSGIPVVFGVIADPVAAGVLTDLSNPSGNMTGVKLDRNQAKRLELFLDAFPQVRKFAVMFNPDDAAPASAVAQLRDAVHLFDAELVEIPCRDDDAVSKALITLADEIDAIFLVPDSIVNKRIMDIVALSLSRRLPVSGPSMAQISQGALMTYGFVHHDVGAQAARMADLILKGTPPGDLPVETADSQLGFNLATADAIGVTIADSFIRNAAVVIRADK